MMKTYTISIPNEIEVTFLDYGGIVQKILVPDKYGKMENVVLGFHDPSSYQDNIPYFGAIIGRYANRIANGTFSIDNRTYHLFINNGRNSIHGGLKGFDKVFWNVEKRNDYSYSLTYQSPDGEEGYPGNLNVEVIYTLKEKEFIIEYLATTDQATHLNLTNHSYFDLSAGKDPNILNHRLFLNADNYTEVDNDAIPTGRMLPVDGVMDFRKIKSMGENIDQVKGGYDHNYVLKRSESPAARVSHPSSGRIMEVYTTEPGIQFYTGNFLDPKHSGFCLETQHFPDTPNHENFPSTLLKSGEKFKSMTRYKFGINS